MEDLTQQQLWPEVVKILKKISADSGIEKFTITDLKRNAKGEGYLGEVFMVTIQDDLSDKELNLVVKSAFKDEKIRDMAPIRKSFENEIYYYSKISPQYKKLCVGKKFRFDPECFQVSLDTREEVLVLENLRMAGFEVFDKRSVLDAEHVKTIFKTYGKFHALSFALQDQNPKLFREISGNVHNLYEAFMVAMAPLLEKCSDLVRKTLESGKDDELLRGFEKYEGSKICGVFQESFRTPEKYGAILHGDCWSNNMMFKYQGQGPSRKLVDMRLLDFQLVKHGSPVCDLSYCLYSGGSKPVFDNLNEYLETYHQSFSSFLRELGSDPEELFPFEALKQEWKKFAKFGFIMGLAVVKMKMTANEDIIDLTDVVDGVDLQDVFANIKYNEEGFNGRVRELLVHLNEIDAL